MDITNVRCLMIQTLKIISLLLLPIVYYFLLLNVYFY